MEDLNKKVTASLKNSSIQHTWSVIHGYIHCRCLAWDSSILVVDHIVDISGIKQTSSRNPTGCVKTVGESAWGLFDSWNPFATILPFIFVFCPSWTCFSVTKDHVVVLVQYADGEAVQGQCCGPYTAASPAYCTVKYSQVFYSSRSQISQTWWPTLCVS